MLNETNNLVVIGIVIFILFYIFKKVRVSTNTTKKQKRIQSDHIFKWPSAGNYDFEIVGESHYQNTIKKIAGDHDLKYGASTECTALLVPEDDNTYDNKAICVEIGSETVGYMSRDDARSFRRRLGQKKLTGQITECKAKIFGGKLGDDGRKHHYGIWLDIKEFDY